MKQKHSSPCRCQMSGWEHVLHYGVSLGVAHGLVVGYRHRYRSGLLLGCWLLHEKKKFRGGRFKED